MNAVDIISTVGMLGCGALLGVIGTLTFFAIKEDQEAEEHDEL